MIREDVRMYCCSFIRSNSTWSGLRSAAVSTVALQRHILIVLGWTTDLFCEARPSRSHGKVKTRSHEVMIGQASSYPYVATLRKTSRPQGPCKVDHGDQGTGQISIVSLKCFWNFLCLSPRYNQSLKQQQARCFIIGFAGLTSRLS